MRVVIDCNIFVSAVSSKSKYHLIVQKLIKGSFHLLLSTEVYFEYQEIISLKYKGKLIILTLCFGFKKII